MSTAWRRNWHFPSARRVGADSSRHIQQIHTSKWKWFRAFIKRTTDHIVQMINIIMFSSKFFRIFFSFYTSGRRWCPASYTCRLVLLWCFRYIWVQESRNFIYTVAGGWVGSSVTSRNLLWIVFICVLCMCVRVQINIIYIYK